MDPKVVANALAKHRRDYKLAQYAGGAKAAGAAALGYAAKKAYEYASNYRGAPSRPSLIKRSNKARLQANANPNKSFYKSKKRVAPKSGLKKLQSQVKTLARANKADMGLLTYRSRTSGRNLAAENVTSYVDIAIWSTTYIESVLGQLRYYDPSAPSTLVQADGTTGSFMKDFYFKRAFCKLTVRNNYQSPAVIAVYNCCVKDDTSVQPYTAMTQGLTDVGAPSATSTLVWPTDSPQFRDLWRVDKTTKVTLQPGEECIVTHQIPPFSYDPSLVDSHSQVFQTRYKGFGFLVRTCGVIGHDTVADQQGILPAGIDWTLDRSVQVEYSAGADIEYVYVTDSLDSMTTSAVVSQKPVADNIAYSVA